MTSKQLFKKSMPFCMAKLGLGAATLLIDGILLALLMGIGWLFGENGMVICFNTPRLENVHLSPPCTLYLFLSSDFSLKRNFLYRFGLVLF